MACLSRVDWLFEQLAHIFVIGLYPFHDTIACMLNGTGALACVRLYPLFDHRTNVTRDMLALHSTIQSVAAATVKELKGVNYWGNVSTASTNVSVCGP